MATTLRARDLTIRDGLTIVRLDGYEGEPEYRDQIDAPGHANWLCEQYGMSDEGFEGPGILWTNYDFSAWEFSVLVDSAEVDALKEFAAENRYEVLAEAPIDEPCLYGDGHAGTVTILRHPDGWVVLAS